MANLYNLDNKFLVTTGGNVLIGQTSAIGSSIFQVTGASTFSGTLNALGGLGGYYMHAVRGNSSPGGNAPAWAILDNTTISSATYGWAWYDSNVDGSFQLWRRNNSTTANHVLTFDRGNSNATFAGNVGIGAAPSVKLDVVGSGKFQPGIADGDALVTIAQTNSNAYVHAGIKINAGNTNPFYIYQSGSSNTLRFNYNSLADAGGQLVITDSGYVGIGTTSPSSPLHVDAAPANGVYLSYLYNSATHNSANGLNVQTSSNNILTYGLRVNTAGDSNALAVMGNGSVGIGTNSPDAKLHIYGSASLSEMYLGEDAAADKAGILKYTQGDGNGTGVITLSHWGNTSTTQSLAIKYGGNVGIGTTSPSTELQVESTNPIITLQRNNNGNAGGAVQFRGSDSVVDWQMGTNQVVGLGLEFNFQNSNKVYIETGGNVGIGTTSPFSNAKLDVNGNIYAKATAATIDVSAYNTTSGLANADLHLAVTSSGEGQVRMYGNYPLTFYTNNTEKMRIRSGGEVNIGSTGDFSAGKLVIQQNQSENGGILTLQNGGTHGYYTRVLHNATSTSQAGYWHIKTNIPVGGNVMFIAKFYGYIYGSAQVLDLTHAGYAYSGTNTVINQGVQNNGNNVNSSSAYYTSANGGKVCFRVAFGAGATFSTYFAGVYMDMAFPSPAGQGHDFEIEAQSFSQNTTVY